MNEFIVQLENRLGEMARLMKALSAQGVNVLVYAVGAGNQASLGFAVNDKEATRSTLDNAGIGSLGFKNPAEAFLDNINRCT